MWVKICGNTTLEDALNAAEAGADALGFIFASSPRQRTPAQVAAITARLPSGIERVGVFDSHDADEILHIAKVAALTTLQLHGGFDLKLLERLLRSPDANLKVIQTLHWAVAVSPEANHAQAHKLLADLRTVADLATRFAGSIRVLVDSRVGSVSGGTGVAFDWNAAAPAFDTARALGLRIIAAGGLVPENVAQAVARLHPSGVDVASGVEASPGRKNPARVAQFIANARG